MKLRVHKIEGFDYSSTDEVIPFVYALEVDSEIVIGSDLRANTCHMIHKSDEMIQVGGSACITSIRDSEATIFPNQPKLLLVNLLNDKDEIGELVPGEYVLYAGLTGTEKTGQSFKPFEIRAEVDVNIV